MCLGHQLGTSGAVTSASLGRWASARLDPDATPDSTSSLFCVKYANTPNRPASPRYRVWPVHKPRRASHTPHPSRLESARGDTVLHGPRSGPIVPHSLATPLVPQRFQRSDILDLNGYYTRSDLAPGGIRASTQRRATSQFPPARHAKSIVYGVRRPHGDSESTRRVVWLQRLASVQRGRRPARGGTSEARDEAERAGGAPGSHARVSF